MFKGFLLMIALTALAACGGGSGDKFVGVEVIEKTKQQTYNKNGTEETLRPAADIELVITGSNNLLRIQTKPKKLVITGNDNYIELLAGTQTDDRGSGNNLVKK